MADLFGRAYWPGVTGAISCRYTVGHGAGHGVAVLVIGTQDVGLIQQTGDLTITDGVNEPVVARGCRVDSVEAPGDGTLVLTIMDGRWRWRFGYVDGWYNQQDPAPDSDGLPAGGFAAASGRPFVPGTERWAVDLAKLCLEAMGVPEERYAIDDEPNLPRATPAVSWRGQNPAAALAQVLDDVGYRLVYQPNADKVLLARLGHGAPLADLPLVTPSAAVHPADPPKAAVACGGPHWLADFLPLEPVGLEADGRVRPLDDLSYKPAAGWEGFPPGTFTPNTVVQGDCQDLGEAAELANMLWSLWRVRVGLNGLDLADALAGDGGPDEDGVVRHRRRLVLAGRVYHAEKDATGQLKTSDPFLVGSKVFQFRMAGGKVANSTEPAYVPAAVAVDPVRGLVRTSRPVFQAEAYSAAVDGVTRALWRTKAPELWVYTSFQLRGKEDLQLVSLRRTKTYLQAGSPLPEAVHLPHLQVVRRVLRGGAERGGVMLGPFAGGSFATGAPFAALRVELNDADVNAEADAAMDHSRRKYELTGAGTFVYGGVHPVDPDGLTHQVTWSVSTDAPATTTVSQGTEHAHWLPPYAERRRKERLPDRWLALAPKVTPPDLLDNFW